MGDFDSPPRTEAGSERRLWYFAYGANMATEAFVRRRGMTPLSSEAARLDGYRLAFSTRGIRLLEPAFANIEKDEGASVHGVLHRLSKRDLELLDCDEGADYRHLRVEVCGVSSGPVQALAYQSSRPVHGLKPSRRYLALLCRGAEEFDLPRDYRQELARVPTYHVPVLSTVALPLVRAGMAVRRVLKQRLGARDKAAS